MNPPVDWFPSANLQLPVGSYSFMTDITDAVSADLNTHGPTEQAAPQTVTTAPWTEAETLFWLDVWSEDKEKLQGLRSTHQVKTAWDSLYAKFAQKYKEQHGTDLRWTRDQACYRLPVILNSPVHIRS